eukprot:scaffold6642_cov101-Isochrysis_galbana.AAC.3
MRLPAGLFSAPPSSDVPFSAPEAGQPACDDWAGAGPHEQVLALASTSAPRLSPPPPPAHPPLAAPTAAPQPVAPDAAPLEPPPHTSASTAGTSSDRSPGSPRQKSTSRACGYAWESACSSWGGQKVASIRRRLPGLAPPNADAPVRGMPGGRESGGQAAGGPPIRTGPSASGKPMKLQPPRNSARRQCMAGRARESQSMCTTLSHRQSSRRGASRAAGCSGGIGSAALVRISACSTGGRGVATRGSVLALPPPPAQASRARPGPLTTAAPPADFRSSARSVPPAEWQRRMASTLSGRSWPNARSSSALTLQSSSTTDRGPNPTTRDRSSGQHSAGASNGPVAERGVAGATAEPRMRGPGAPDPGPPTPCSRGPETSPDSAFG